VSVVARVTAVPDVARALPWLLRARWRMRRTRDLRALVAEHDWSARPRRARSVPSLRRGVDGALRIVGPHDEHCVPRALALFALLTRAGYDAVFVSGVRKVGDDLHGHAWVLVDDRPLEAPTVHDPRATYREQFRIASKRSVAE
jgi:hypothetical protein